MTHIADLVRIRPISQLIRDISRVLQKLLKFFNGTVITAPLMPSLLVLSNNLDLSLNASESPIGYLGSSLQYWYLNNYRHTLSNYTSAF